MTYFVYVRPANTPAIVVADEDGEIERGYGFKVGEGELIYNDRPDLPIPRIVYRSEIKPVKIEDATDGTD